jgi:glucose-6-phosphate 1-dehydrogenase
VIERIVLFGASGDLAARFLLPALATLAAADHLPEGFQVVGAARKGWDDEAFRNHAAASLERHAAAVPTAVRTTLLRALRYCDADVRDPAGVATALRAADGSSSRPVAVYLGVPPSVFPAAVSALASAQLPAGSRIALEKPFGEDLDRAIALNASLARIGGGAGEDAVFRVDHVLGMATAQNLLALRTANSILERVWDGRHIEQVEVLWEETLALEGRAGYYDHAGALKDVMQNHMLQVLCLAAMEPPSGRGSPDVRDRRVELLRSVRSRDAVDARSWTNRARYTAGRIASGPGGRTQRIPAYVDEPGVDPTRGTETFAEVVLDVANERWRGTRFVLRAGKAMRRTRRGVVVTFRPSARAPDGEGAAPANRLWIGVEGSEDLALHLNGSARLPRLTPLTLTAPAPASDLPPYGRILLDLLNGERALSIRGDEAEAAWRVMTPVLEAWRGGRVPLGEYPAGSDGPARL